MTDLFSVRKKRKKKQWVQIKDKIIMAKRKDEEKKRKNNKIEYEKKDLLFSVVM